MKAFPVPSQRLNQGKSFFIEERPPAWRRLIAWVFAPLT